MRLADEVIISFGTGRLELRPSLRAAIRLERRHGGLNALIAGIIAGKLTVVADVIAETMAMTIQADRQAAPVALQHFGADDVLPILTASPLSVSVTPIIPAVLAIVDGFVATGEAKGESTTTKASPIGWGEHFARLYRIGTGHLGWTPETTLAATPVEIIEAFRGRQELLAAIFGGGEKAKPKDERPLADKFRAMFDAVGVVDEAA